MRSMTLSKSPSNLKVIRYQGLRGRVVYHDVQVVTLIIFLHLRIVLVCMDFFFRS
jgi:hypothetical protein